MANLVNSTAKNFRKGEGAVIGIAAITDAMFAEVATLGVPSSRLYVGDVISFDPATISFGTVLDKAGKITKRADGTDLNAFYMKALVTANGQSREIEFDLSNIVGLCQDRVLGELATKIGMTAADGNGGRVKKLLAHLQTTPTATFIVDEMFKNPVTAKKTGIVHMIDVPSFIIK